MNNETYENYLSEEQELIDSSIKDIDDLYTEVKGHLDVVKRSNSRGTLNFIQGQTSNLISLKTAKSNLISARINIKKLEAELTLKKQARESDNDANGGEMVMQLAKQILNTKVDKSAEVVEKDIEVEEDADTILAQRLAELESEGQIEYTDNDLRIKYENDGIELIIVKKGERWKFVAKDSNNKVVKDYPVPKNDDMDITFITDSKGRLSAKDENGFTYKVKEVKD